MDDNFPLSQVKMVRRLGRVEQSIDMTSWQHSTYSPWLGVLITDALLWQSMASVVTSQHIVTHDQAGAGPGLSDDGELIIRGLSHCHTSQHWPGQVLSKNSPTLLTHLTSPASVICDLLQLMIVGFWIFLRTSLINIVNCFILKEC